MKRLFLFLFFAIMSLSGWAQIYTTGIGVRAGKFNTGVSVKHFYNTDNATGMQLDGYYSNIISGGYLVKGFVVKQLSVKLPIVQLPLDLVWGAGLEIGYFPYRKDPVYIGYYKLNSKKEAEQYGKSVVTAGVDAMFGLEYRIPYKIAPVTVGIDVNPFYVFYHPGPEWLDFGLAVRYVFR